jgi:hypothetical protein
MSDSVAFTILGVVALCVGWPTWVWAIAFSLAALGIIAELGDGGR